MRASVTLTAADALVVVDVQNDFLPDGALAVPDGEKVIPSLNNYITLFTSRNLTIIATRDWHPANHCSFKKYGGLWPVHCVAGSAGAQFSSELLLPARTTIISKDLNRLEDDYSCFRGTNVAQQLYDLGIKRLFVGGLATDYCVLNTVLDAVKNGFEVVLLADAVRPVNLHSDDGRKAEEAMARVGAKFVSFDDLIAIAEQPGILLTDFYELTMLQAYFREGMNGTAVFEFFVRNLPKNRGFLVSAGLEQLLEYLQQLHFSDDEIRWLASIGRFDDDFLDYMRTLRFAGDVDAMPEGTIFFAQEPTVRVTAPICEGQLIETRLINIVQFQTMVASKAVRCVIAADGKPLVDFGLRRAHGAEAGNFASRASYLAGFAATSNVAAAQQFGIPPSGTMAHSYVLAHIDETEAFEKFAHANPADVVMLIDTYDTEAAARKVVRLAERLRSSGLAIHAVRIDSGDLVEESKKVRRILDDGDCQDTQIFASGGLDEHEVELVTKAGVPIDGFGVGTALVTSADAPYLECAYKLQEYDGRPVRKRSEAKESFPGRKQVFRTCDEIGFFQKDEVGLETDASGGEPLLIPIMRKGKRIVAAESPDQIRARVRRGLEQLPLPHRELKPTGKYPVEFSASVNDLARLADEQIESALTSHQ